MFSHNLPTDRARELFNPSKNEESLLVSILKYPGTFGFEIFWGRCHEWVSGKVFWMTSSGPEEIYKGKFLCFFFYKIGENLQILSPRLAF